MTSDKQFKANQENAQHSSGPASSSGRKKSSMNAVTHGFAGQTVVIPAHEAAGYAKHFDSFRKEYNPATPTEEFMVQSLAELSYSTQQIRAQTTNCISILSCKTTDRHENTTPEIEAALAQARGIAAGGPTLNTLGIYEQRKMRLFTSTRKELVQAQTERKAREKAELEQAMQMRRADKATRLPEEPEWQPHENGFVHSLAEIDRQITLHDRFSRPIKPQNAGA